MKNYFFRRSLSRQILVLMIIILGVVLGSFITTNKVAESIIEKRTSESANKIMLQVQDKFLSFYTDMEGISSALLYSPTINTYMRAPNSLTRILMNKDMESVFMNTSSLKASIKGIHIYDKTGNVIADFGLGYGDTSLNKKVNKIEYSGIRNISGGDQFKRYYSISVPIFNLDNNYKGCDYNGECTFIMGNTDFTKILKNSLLTKNSMLLLLDQNSNIIASGSNIQNSRFNIKRWEKDKSYMVQMLSIPHTKWKLVSVIPNVDMLRDMYIIKGLNIAVYLVMITIICFLIFLFSTKILRPVKELVKFMNTYTKKAGKNRFHVKSKNEIGMIGINLNKMLDDIEMLNEEVQTTQSRMYQMEIANKQMEIAAYRNQINPHFLYNTLECIRGIALYYNVNDIGEISASLSNIFRYSVKGNDLVTVQDEIFYVKEYAKIIEFRFMKRIQIKTNVDDSLLSENVLKMLLQPIVENAVFHGLEKKIEDGIVLVNADRIEGNRIRFIISDNGCGIDEEKFGQIVSYLDHDWKDRRTEEESGFGIGILNIYRRIKLFYGDDATMDIQSTVSVGTTVSITIPLK